MILGGIVTGCILQKISKAFSPFPAVQNTIIVGGKIYKLISSGFGVSELLEGLGEIGSTILKDEKESYNIIRDYVYQGDASSYETDRDAMFVINSNILTLDNYISVSSSVLNEIKYVKVGRWMSVEEYEMMIETGKVQISQEGLTHVTNPANPDSYSAAKNGSIFVEFEIDSNCLVQGGKEGWGIIAGPDSIYSRLFEMNGTGRIQEIPDAFNIEIIERK